MHCNLLKIPSSVFDELMEELDNIYDDVHTTTDRIRAIVVVVVMRSLAKSL